VTLDWAVGLFEGEGTAYVSYRGRNTLGAPQVALVTTDIDVLRRFKRVVGVGRIYGPYQNKKKQKPYWRWATHTWEEGLAVLHSFYPHLGERRRAQSRVVFDAWKERKKDARWHGSRRDTR